MVTPTPIMRGRTIGGEEKERGTVVLFIGWMWLSGKLDCKY